MLKKLVLNRRSIPVPVPVKELGQVLSWLESAMVPDGSYITKVTLDGHDLEYDGGLVSTRDHSIRLTEQSALEIRVDSLASLSGQTLDTIHSLSAAILGTLKSIAVHSWQSRQTAKIPELAAVHDDLALIVSLVNHVQEILRNATGAGLLDTGPVSGIARLMDQNLNGHALAMRQSDWKACARILLNRFEPLLKDLMVEAETLQIRVLAIQSQLELSPEQGGCGTIGDIAPFRPAITQK